MAKISEGIFAIFLCLANVDNLKNLLNLSLLNVIRYGERAS